MKRVGAAGLLLGMTGFMLSPGQATAEGVGRSFAGVASASGGYVKYGIPGFLIVENYIDGGAPVSQAILDSSSGGESFASLPYPGDTFVEYPGLAAFALGVAPPPYPLRAQATRSQPEATVGEPEGAMFLSASAGADLARSSGRVGETMTSNGSLFVGRADTEVKREGERVTARAVSLTRGIVVGPLSVGSVASMAEATYTGGGAKPVTKTELSVNAGKVGDLTFSVGDQGLQVADHGIPVPAGSGLAALNEALKPAGIAAGFSKSEAIEGGSAAAVFEITSIAEVPTAGKGTLRLQFGGAKAQIKLGATDETVAEGESATPQVAAGDRADLGPSGDRPTSDANFPSEDPVVSPRTHGVPGEPDAYVPRRLSRSVGGAGVTPPVVEGFSGEDSPSDSEPSPSAEPEIRAVLSPAAQASVPVATVNGARGTRIVAVLTAVMGLGVGLLTLGCRRTKAAG